MMEAGRAKGREHVAFLFYATVVLVKKQKYFNNSIVIADAFC